MAAAAAAAFHGSFRGVENAQSLLSVADCGTKGSPPKLVALPFSRSTVPLSSSRSTSDGKKMKNDVLSLLRFAALGGLPEPKSEDEKCPPWVTSKSGGAANR